MGQKNSCQIILNVPHSVGSPKSKSLPDLNINKTKFEIVKRTLVNDFVLAKKLFETDARLAAKYEEITGVKQSFFSSPD